MRLVSKRLLGGVAVLSIFASACSSGATASPAASSAAPATSAPVETSAAPSSAAPSSAAPSSEASGTVDTSLTGTVEWWHITTGEPGKTQVWQKAADDFVKLHPNVKINITVLENEAFKTKLQTVAQGGKMPDLFQSWGGGTMAQQAQAGLLKDITNDVKSWAGPDQVNAGAMSIYQYNGKQYGIPWDMGMIGFFYNKTYFQQAGITAVPTTWTEFLADIDKLKTAGAGKYAPYAIAGKDEWPGMHLWTYLTLRSGGGDALKGMIDSKNWNTDACKAGGEQLKKLVDKNPFQDGWKSAVYDKGEAAAMGNGKAAIELMGQWAQAVQNSNSTTGKGIGDALGWFPFPAVDGGKGDPNDGVGGGNGVAVGKDAGPAALEFLHYLMSKNVQDMIGAGPKLDGKDTMGIPTLKVSEASITDPILKQILEGRGKAKFMQLYLDQATSPAMGAAINDATAKLFLGQSTPEQVCQDITDAAQSQ